MKNTLIIFALLILGCSSNSNVKPKTKTVSVIVVLSENSSSLRGDLIIIVPNKDKRIIDLSGMTSYETTFDLKAGQGAAVNAIDVRNMIHIYYKNRLIKKGRQLSVDYEELN